MTRLLAIVEYDGTDYAGWQVQKGHRTVQGELERALAQVTGESASVVGAGRTDAGVHALGQGAHFDSTWDRSPKVLQRALNAVLPNDIAIRSIVPVPSDFSARYSAHSRTYRYTIFNRAIRSPLMERYALWIQEPLDEQAMDAAAQYLVGQHDFGAFGRPPRGENCVRRVEQARVERDGDCVQILAEANAFLYRMMRRLVGTLVLVGRGTLTVSEFRQVLAKKRRAGPSVPPQGLCLIAVKYGQVGK